MKLIDLFRRLVFAQVLLGIMAFCIAERNPGLLLVVGALGALSWYVVEGPTGRPLPRWAINLGALSAVLRLIADMLWLDHHVILATGHFMMWLLMLLLYAHKTNREYSQLLVLSLMQMIVASILPGGVSIVYGLILAGYCVLALFTVLLFQLKISSDAVFETNRAASPTPDRVTRPEAVVGRGHRWQFRLTAASVGLVCAAIAVFVFVALPRTASRMGSALDSEVGRKHVGYSKQVNLSGPPPNAGSREPVLNLAVIRNGRNIGNDYTSWLVRGAALDYYDSRTHAWSRSLSSSARDRRLYLKSDGITLAELARDVPTTEAQVTLRTSSVPTLFTLHPVTHYDSASLRKIQFNPEDQQLTTNQAITGAAVYTVRWPTDPPPGLFEGYKKALPPREAGGRPQVTLQPVQNGDVNYRDATRNWSIQTDRVRELTLSVIRRVGLDRDPNRLEDPNDPRIAWALVHYLRNPTNYSYSLNNPMVSPLEDPVAQFLFNLRQGHCELFASALAAMARSIGMSARVITGFRASEYNHIGGYYVIRQRHAHAWTEIYCSDYGWQQFDATPPDEVMAEHHVRRSWFTGLRELYEHLEFTWIGSVVAYDQRTRAKLLSGISRSFSYATGDDRSWIGSALAFIRGLPQRWRFDPVGYISIVIVSFFILLAVATLVYLTLVHRRRVMSLQLANLPRSTRRGMVQQLRFYNSMLDMLERHGYRRPAWQSPFNFAQELARNEPTRLDPVVTLTQMFYEIRFGHREFDAGRRQRTRALLRRLELVLARRA
ncbi:MAG: transglutaminaseTgpA domain-containing protein [Phycisphaeraceae bacterium]